MNKRSTLIILFSILAVIILAISFDSKVSSPSSSNIVGSSQTSEATTKEVVATNPVPDETITTAPISTTTPLSTKKKETSTVSSSSFTNKYGTPTTLCAHSGCSNYIASSGDTNCCTTHSRKCLECGKYIDEDATYCMDCLKKAAEQAASSSGKKCEKCSKTGTKVLVVTQPSGERASFNLCQSHYDEYKAYFNSKKGWSAW